MNFHNVVWFVVMNCMCLIYLQVVRMNMIRYITGQIIINSIRIVRTIYVYIDLYFYMYGYCLPCLSRRPNCNYAKLHFDYS